MKFLLKYRKDIAFERKMGTKFITKIDQKTLGIYSHESSNALWKSKATQYQTSSLVAFSKAFRSVDLDRMDFQNFYDLGSGKGKMVFFAENKKIADNCVGIEADSYLYLESLSIKNKFNSSTDFIKADASSIILKLQNDEKNLFFVQSF